MAELKERPVEEELSERACWWPVSYIQNGQTAVGCSKYPATEMRVHPLCGCETWLCGEHAREFDEVLT